jgi:hypothetical protein
MLRILPESRFVVLTRTRTVAVGVLTRESRNRVTYIVNYYTVREVRILDYKCQCSSH